MGDFRGIRVDQRSFVGMRGMPFWPVRPTQQLFLRAPNPKRHKIFNANIINGERREVPNIDLLRENTLERGYKMGRGREEKDIFVLRVPHKTAPNPSSLQPLSPAKGKLLFYSIHTRGLI